MTSRTSPSSMTDALRIFETTEANLAKAEAVWDRLLRQLDNSHDVLDESAFDYDRNSLIDLVKVLPPVDSFRPAAVLPPASEIIHQRLACHELDDPTCTSSVEATLRNPGRELREYRFRFAKARRRLVRSRLEAVVPAVEADLGTLQQYIDGSDLESPHSQDPAWARLSSNVDTLATLMGKDVSALSRWSDLRRHLRFGEVHDLRDIVEHDWPAVRLSLQSAMYGDDDPIPCADLDLSALAGSRPVGPVPQSLAWGSLSDEDFEELLFHLISGAAGYESPQLLMKTNAPDRGRDLSAYRVRQDSLSGAIRERVIVQCKHYLSGSVSVSDISSLPAQMQLWEPPTVNVLVVATSSRFTADAVMWIEKHNNAGPRTVIEMWPDKHLEGCLAARPDLIARYRLR